MEQAVAAAGAALTRVFDHVQEEVKELKQTDETTLARMDALQADLTTVQDSHERLREQAKQLESALNNERKLGEKLSASLLKAIGEFKAMQEGNDEILRQHNELVARVQKHENFQTTLQLLSSAADEGSIVLKIQTTADGNAPNGSPLNSYRKSGNELELSFARPEASAAEQGQSIASSVDGCAANVPVAETNTATFKKPLPQKPSRGKRSGLNYTPGAGQPAERFMHGSIRDEDENDLQTGTREQSVMSSTTFHSLSDPTEVEKLRQNDNQQKDLGFAGSPVPVQSNGMDFNAVHAGSTPTPSSPIQETVSVPSGKRKRDPSRALSEPDESPQVKPRKAAPSTKRRRAQTNKSVESSVQHENDEDGMHGEIVVAQRKSGVPTAAIGDVEDALQSANGLSSETEKLLNSFNITQSGHLTPKWPNNLAQNDSVSAYRSAAAKEIEDDARDADGFDTSDLATYSQLRSQFQTRTGDMQKEAPTVKRNRDTTTSMKEGVKEREVQGSASNAELLAEIATGEGGPKSRLRKQPAKSAKKRAQE